ncbi:hypothetical protein [Phocaeicola plebeius]|jgi:hypothetical protein|uniref:Lipoprotein n=1 Tax=Phocaeicola plebeius TaxID=310297 RepID=A0A415THC9_9BACT|nr:hypothetical protein [Phocaeicola plebeius]MBS4810675.1 hypothetical protein [Bacteroides sp.]MBS4825554.1 hypothetical protein [Bacteroides sp.]RGZ56092.1 hypothetical protein DW982_07955 [Phocaeicola plebeius]RHA29103.1 hypothetical protein DW941_10000 [Phocaeicola plebeius]RHA33202.1 hypothetical protein DW939_10030 [Phocaeicola plebeius]
MRKKHLLMTITVLCTTFGCSTHKAMYQARLDEAKGYALAACIACMNKSIDSLSVINKDYSTGYFVQLSHLSLDEIIEIKQYVDKECMKYWGVPQEPDGNMIGYSVWKFYTSKELDNFIQEALK